MDSKYMQAFGGKAIKVSTTRRPELGVAMCPPSTTPTSIVWPDQHP